MKNIIKLVVIISFLFLISLNAKLSSAEPIIAMALDSINPHVGQEIMIRVIINGEDIANAVGWNGCLLFESDLLSFQGAIEGAFNPVESIFVFNSLEPGKVILINYNMLLNTINGQGTIAEVTLIPSRSGTSSITLSNFTFSDPVAENIPVTLGPELEIQIESNPADLDGDDDVDGSDLHMFITSYQAGVNTISVETFAQNYGLGTWPK